MTEQSGERVRVRLRWIQILDNLEPFFKEKGEFRFGSKVTSDNRGGIVQETRFPEEGHWEISDHPAWNREFVDKVIFEGAVDDHLIVELFGEEIDTLSANDQLDHYRREFRGPAESWFGLYGPGDDLAEDEVSTDPEAMSNWRVCYLIERADGD